jgi:hypothetical protein
MYGGGGRVGPLPPARLPGGFVVRRHRFGRWASRLPLAAKGEPERGSFGSVRRPEIHTATPSAPSVMSSTTAAPSGDICRRMRSSLIGHADGADDADGHSVLSVLSNPKGCPPVDTYQRTSAGAETPVPQHLAPYMSIAGSSAAPAQEGRNSLKRVLQPWCRGRWARAVWHAPVEIGPQVGKSWAARRSGSRGALRVRPLVNNSSIACFRSVTLPGIHKVYFQIGEMPYVSGRQRRPPRQHNSGNHAVP